MATRAPKKNPAAVSLGRRGGKATSPAKAAASRRNGQLGGRPRTKASASKKTKAPRVSELPPGGAAKGTAERGR